MGWIGCWMSPASRKQRHRMSIETSAALFEQVDALTEYGQLRRLSGAFARFIASVGASSPQLMAVCVLLSELEGRGHSCLMLDELQGDLSGQLGWTGDEWRALRDAAGAWPRSADAWRTLLAGCDQVMPVGGKDLQQPLVLDGERLYLRRYWRDETLVAEAVRGRALGGLIALDAETSTADVRHWLDILFPHAPRGGVTDWQKIACAVAMRGKLGIITGGPGTGKTYTVARLLALLFATAGDRQSGLRVALAAPTGKAAARLKQSIDTALDDLAEKVGSALPLRELAARMGPARTLHSLLGARPDTRVFQHNAGNQLEVDVLIVDEASMIHLEMMSALLAALPKAATLILLGDKDQLASVEAGAVLGDLCHNAEAGGYESETLSYVQASSGQQIPDNFAGDGGPIAQQTVMLRESRRFGGPIGALALAVNAGNAAASLQVLRDSTEGKVAWIDPAQTSDLLQLALSGRAGAAGGYQAYLKMIKNGAAEGDEIVHLAWVKSVLTSFETFRILCAVREGEWGVAGLNDVIEQRLQSAGLLRRSGEWYVGRPVMVTRNDYGTGVFNGDIGLTLPDPARPGALRVYFSEGDNVRSVLATRLRNVETAFAMTVHKSQGSEFQHTVLVLPKDSGGMLARELIYTGITRARDYFTLLTPNGQVLLDAIAQRTQRASGLRTLLGN
ncbi:exodeoxyribonuclease V subunit alpha [Duganella violaceipulchra]|uniref:RecBCD enzyme subunit RecD n=2 Tax=Duganella violaceipulchra TaxID=2849652 RepID=A0ABT1GBZ1_9BURK|nr:exodeoxyribonuclease V subunit alpha [Duganella violaceicalia]MCP2006465.1 exodeoxyribonuclease V alpha subunit [Duganella violaceicalia]